VAESHDQYHYSVMFFTIVCPSHQGLIHHTADTTGGQTRTLFHSHALHDATALTN